jgi:hypothetical protein
MWRRSHCTRRVERAGEDGGARPRFPSLGDEGVVVVARTLTRVCACADELRSMGAERAETHARTGGAGGGWGSAARNVYSVMVPPSMERMLMDP